MNRKPPAASLREGKDYYFENGLMVFTAHYHLRRGYCCQSGCRHCPFNKDDAPPPPTIPLDNEGRF